MVKPRCLVERSLPEVVIVDLELPAIDGLEVARRLREGYGKQMRLIANTAWPDNAETHSKTTDAGFDDVLIKPTSIYQLSRPFSTAESNLPCNGSSPSRPWGAV